MGQKGAEGDVSRPRGKAGAPLDASGKLIIPSPKTLASAPPVRSELGPRAQDSLASLMTLGPHREGNIRATRGQHAYCPILVSKWA